MKSTISRGRTWTWRIAGAGFVIAAAWVVWSASRPLQETLISRSKQVNLPPNRFFYDWLSADTIVTFGGTSPGWLDAMTVRVDGSGRPQLMQSLTGALSKYPDRTPTAPRLSPDGKWALWPGTGPNGLTWVAARLDGTKTVTMPRTAPDVMADKAARWLPKSGGWLEICENGPKPSLSVLDPNRNATFMQTLQDTPQTCIGTSADGKALLTTVGGAPGSAQMMSVDAQKLLEMKGTTPATVAKLTAQYDARMEDYEMTVSPAGDRIAWKFGQKRATDTTWIGQAKWNIGLVPTIRYSLCVSKLDGSDMREIGMLESRGNQLGFHTLRWSPDSKKIGFFNDGKLYVVPAD